MIPRTRLIATIVAGIALGLAAAGWVAHDGVSPLIGTSRPDGSLAASLMAVLAETAGSAAAHAQARRNCETARRGTRSRRCVQRTPWNFADTSDNNFDPLITPDGRFVVVTSRENLDDDPLDEVASEGRGGLDIFLQDFQTGRLRRVSVDVAGNLLPPAQFGSAAVSANGRLVAFATDGAFLPEDRNGVGDVYLKNVKTGRLTLLSVAVAAPPGRAAGGVPVVDGRSVAISDKGRFVAFMTTAALDSARDGNDTLDLYVKNRKTDRLFLASIDNEGMAGGVAEPGSSFPEDPTIDISADGRFVAFTSRAPLDLADENREADVYVWDRRHPLATPVLASINADPRPGSDLSSPPLSSHPALSADGRLVVFQSRAALVEEDDNDVSDIYLYDRNAPDTNIRVSLDAERRETAVQGSRDPTISANGRFVAFSSGAGDLVLHDTGLGFSPRGESEGVTEDIFVKDLQTGAITRANLDADGIEPDGTSFSPSLSADGRWIAFLTDDASILEPPDGSFQPGDTVVSTGIDFGPLPAEDVPGAPAGAIPIERPFPLDFALRNAIEQSDDQDWFRVFLLADRTYVIDLEGSPTGQGTLGDPFLRVLRATADGEDAVPVDEDDDDDVGEGEDFNAKLAFQPLEDGTYFISAEGLGAATGTYRLLVRERGTAASATAAR